MTEKMPVLDVPVVQISLDRSKSARQPYQPGQQLKELRQEGVMIVSSGNIVHNLGMVVFDDNLPLFYTLGLKDEAEPISFFADKITYGAISMRSIKPGQEGLYE
jgi:4,5-DOPA dioxygenase extradiol